MQMSCLDASTLSFQKLLQTHLICRNNMKKCLGNDTYFLSVRVQTKINFISICFLPQYQRQRKCFSSERKLKKALRDTRTRAAWYGLLKTSVVPVSQRYVIKQMVNAIACTIELWMHLRGLLSTQEASFVPSNLPRTFITQ